MKKIEKIGKRVRVFTVNEEPSMVQKDQAKEADINHLMERYTKRGIPLPVKQGFYADLSEVGTLQEAAQNIDQAAEAFMQLPATVRKEFNNDPIEFITEVQNPAKKARMIELGLIEQPPQIDLPIETATEPQT